MATDSAAFKKHKGENSMTKKNSKPIEEYKRNGAPCEIQGFPPSAPKGAGIILGSKTVIIITDSWQLQRILKNKKDLPQ